MRMGWYKWSIGCWAIPKAPSADDCGLLLLIIAQVSASAGQCILASANSANRRNLLHPGHDPPPQAWYDPTG